MPIDFIWNDLLINPMLNMLILLSNVLFDSYGLAIIAFTILIRLATYPLTLRQLRATRALGELGPRLQDIQKRYKDPKRRQEETLKLYRQAGVNPLGCALPFLIQLPLWIALFQVIRRSLGGTPEALFSLSGRLYDWEFITGAIPLDRDFLVLDLSNPSFPLAILVGLSTFYQQKLSTARSARQDERAASMNRTMLWMMPIMFTFFALSVPSGLSLYWFITGLFGAVAGYFYGGRKQITWRWLISLEPAPPTVPATAAAVDPAPAPPPAAPAEPSQLPSGRRRRRRRRRRSGSAQQGRAQNDHGREQ